MAASQPKPKGFDSCFDTENSFNIRALTRKTPLAGDGKQSPVAPEPLKSSCYHTENPACGGDKQSPVVPEPLKSSCFRTDNPHCGGGWQCTVAQGAEKSSCFHTEKPALMQDLVEGGGQIATSCFHTENL